MPRRPRWWEEDEDPDYRFSLANERTFLAWIRTSLALLAGAVTVVQLLPPFAVPGARTALGLVLGLLGLLIAATAYPRWAGNERAMRRAAPLPHTPVLLVVGVLLALLAVVVVVLVLADSSG